ncbi:MAG: sugar kinase [Anaerolineales bacterium]|nr:sugar kinase [Anaerolineales bacterium]
MRKYDLLVAGEINPDLILAMPATEIEFGQVETLVENGTLTIGSSSVIFACGAARLGLKVGFLGVVGDDTFGQFMLAEMQKRGIDTTNVIITSEQHTGISVILNRGVDRAILTYVGAMNGLSPEHVSDEILQQTGHLHIASFFLQTQLRPGVAEIFKRAQALGLSTSLDTNWDPAGEWQGLDAALENTSVFFPNLAEGQALTGQTEVELVLAGLATKTAVVAMKLGAAGGIAQSGEEITRATPPQVHVVDTVGAGDSFDAGFIYGYLQGWRLQRCLQLAVVCGSQSTQAAGGTAGQPTLAQAMERVDELA